MPSARKRRNEDYAYLAAFARVELGIPRSEFLTLRPRDLNAMVKVWRQREQRCDLRIARLCHTIARSTGCTLEDGSPVTLETFIPTARKKRAKPTGDDLLDQFCKAIGIPKPKVP